VKARGTFGLLGVESQCDSVVYRWEAEDGSGRGGSCIVWGIGI
jgi:hypothetical protein